MLPAFSAYLPRKVLQPLETYEKWILEFFSADNHLRRLVDYNLS